MARIVALRIRIDMVRSSRFPPKTRASGMPFGGCALLDCAAR